jgi:drug/metabolite transporter (DMT)-like permease
MDGIFMILPPYVLIPLGTGLTYAVAALLLKRAMQQGVGPWRVTFVANWVLALVFLPLWFAGRSPFAWNHLGTAALTGLTFFAGQIFTFLSLGRGDASVATPVLGTKVIFVALLTLLLLGDPVPGSWWVAALLTTVATALLGSGGSGGKGGGGHGLTLCYAFLSAASFSVTDILTQKYLHLWGIARFVPAMFLTVGMLSILLMPLFSGNLRGLPSKTWRWLVPGAGLLAVQSFGMAFVIGEFGHATVVNIVHSSRGVWSVVLVWLAGHWFENAEREQGHCVMIRRLAGSALVVCAIWIVAR